MNSKRNASFVERLGALIIDLAIITLFTSIFSTFVVNKDNYDKLTKESTELMENYMDGKIKPTTYINRASDISYDIARETGGLSIITLGVYILYFIVFQFKNKGQTIGKKVFKLRVVSNDERELNMNNFAIRSLIVNNILGDLIILSLSILGTKNIYFESSMIVEVIEYGLIFATAITVLSRTDKRGIHDLITNTKVIKEI